jgi:hypothetical protein
MGGTRMRGGWFVAVLAIASPGLTCKEVEPETGSIRPTCKDADSNPAAAVDFARDIRPLIDNEVAGTKGCLFCHSPTSGSMEGFLQTGLDLTKLQAIRRGSREDTDVVVPGKPCESIVVQKLQGTFPEGARMPKDGPYWDDAKIQLMIDWIAEGAQGADE